MSWTDEDIENLRKYWAEGHSTAEIGRLIGKSKNAVVGKAHRLSLPSRPSPIKKSSVAPKAVEQPKASETVVDPAEVEEAPVKAAPKAGASAAAAKAATASTPSAAAPRRPALQPRTKAKGPRCQWPYGHPDDAEFKFCLREVLAGKPYCPEHSSIAYIPASKKGEAREAERRAQLMAQEGQKIGWASELAAAPKKTGDAPYIPRMFTAALDDEFHQIAKQDMAEQKGKK